MPVTSHLTPFKTPWLILPITLYFLLTALYFFAIPPGESPDEPGHMVCVEQVAQYHRLPLREPAPQGDVWWSRGRIIAGHMCYHMPLYYLTAGFLLDGTAQLTNTPNHFEFPPTNPDGPQPNMFLHVDKPLFGTIPEPVTMITLRMFSIGLGLVSVLAAFLLGGRLYPHSDWPGVIGALLTAGWVQFVALSQGINNDVLATALAVLTLLVLVQIGKPRRFILAAILASLAVLTKVTMLFTIGAVFLVWALELIYLKSNKKDYVSAIVIGGLLWTGTFLLISLHPVLRENLRISTGAFTAVTDNVKSWAYWQQVIILTISSGWARLGWMGLPAPQWHANLWWALIAIFSFIGITRLWKNPLPETKLLTAILLIWLAGILFTYLRINLNRLQPQFRFAFAAIPVLAAWAGGGIDVLLPRRRRKVGIVILAALLVSYNIWFITAVLGPAYGWRLM